MDKIGRYAIERRIGAGSFATVWLGHDVDLDVPVAVKVLADNWAGNDDVRNRFLAEARIMRRIHDPRLVQVYDIGSLDDGRPYFVMDYIDGGSLNELRKSGLNPVAALRLCVEACRALEVLHSADIIHRDVTPGNLLLSTGADGQPRVLIADLGVAKSLIDTVGATMTAGTPSYMAPEQAGGSMPLDRRADIYSLTAVTYAMLTGRPPFPVKSIADILSRDPGIQPEPLAGRLNAPAALDAVMISGLAYDRNRRPPTALLLADGLATLASQLEAARSGVAAPRSAVPETRWPAGRSSAESRLAPPPEETVVTVPTPVSDPPMPTSQPSPWGGYHQPTPASGPASSQLQSFAESYSEQIDPYPASQVGEPPPAQPVRRGGSYYAMLGVGALALFAISMFVTILLLR